MPAEREYTSSPSSKSDTVHKVPFFFRIEILVSECQEAESVRCLVLSKSLIYFSGIELLDTIVYPLFDIMMLVEVNGCLNDCGFALFWLVDNFFARANKFNFTCPEESLTICLELCAHFLVN